VNPKAANLSAIILAGGKSTRFGRDKTRMEIGGTRVVARLAEVVANFPFRSFAVVTAKDSGGQWPAGFQIITDDREGLGPIGAIATALRRLPSGVFAIACDMPFASVAMVEWFLQHYDGEADAIVPRHARGIEPLFAIYQKSLLPRLDEAIDAGHLSLHAALHGGGIRFVDVPDRFSVAREFANINTREEYERAQKLL
jgi:molybdenum cofactor guanylyltransferase